MNAQRTTCWILFLMLGLGAVLVMACGKVRTSPSHIPLKDSTINDWLLITAVADLPAPRNWRLSSQFINSKKLLTSL